MIMPNFPYKWYLKDGYPQSLDNSVVKNNYNVFGTFINGGGSTMGYKLAGFNHLGGVEIDAATAECYKLNHNPKYLYIEDIRKFNKREDLPNELYNLDILDGSPPCSTFSSAGLRIKSLGIKKVFKEGKVEQTLDDLVFEYANTINKLRPKIFLLENVSGILHKTNNAYIHIFLKELANYNYQVFLLNSSTMRLPQSRERCFIVGYNKKYNLPKINLDFQSEIIPFKDISDNTDTKTNLTPFMQKEWDNIKQGGCYRKFKTVKKSNMNRPVFTITTRSQLHPLYKRELNKVETLLASSFPLDYKFSGHKYSFYCAMCVPPLVIANISLQIKLQWLDKIK